MAIASIQKVQKEVITEIEATEITLKLTPEEAFIIKVLCGNMIGHSKFRQEGSKIYDALSFINTKKYFMYFNKPFTPLRKSLEEVEFY
ncbi:MAG: hypothetical protein AABY07_01190 [Nanoarchaeota archaeon]